GAVARGPLRTAVVALAGACLLALGAAEGAAEVGAVGRIEEHVAVVVLDVEDRPVAAGDRRFAVIAIVVELLGQVALRRPHRVGLLGLHAQQGVPAAAGAVDAGGEADASALAAALLVAADAAA